MKCELCNRNVKRGSKLCNKHYFEQRSLSQPLCNVKGCKSKAFSRGYCQKHYMRIYRSGSLELNKRIYGTTVLDEYNAFKEMYNNAVGVSCMVRIRHKLLILEQQALEMGMELSAV
jgi:hypothetical protein